MSHSDCTYEGKRDDLIVAYVYDDIEPAARAAFEDHLARCAVCRQEIDALGVVRTQLARWSPPEPRALTAASGPAPASDGARSTGRSRSAWDMLGDIPAWAQVAAALLVLGVSAGIANIEVRYDANGFALRTGWSEVVPAASAPAPAASQAAGPQVADTTAWRADLAALEQSLRDEIAVLTKTVANDGRDPLAARVQALLAESERRQQSELALRVAEVIAEVNAQRQADLFRIQRAIGAVETSAGVAVMRNQQMINSLALRAGQRQ